MLQWGAKLRDDLKVDSEAAKRLATAISHEISQLPEEIRFRIMNATPVGLRERIDELVAFQSWMDFAFRFRDCPEVVRAQVITQNYVCFVYLGDAWFKVLRKELGSESAVAKCCKYLTDNPVRAFRNAMAHDNWRYNADYSGLQYWAKKGSDPDEPIIEWEVSQQDLNFWQSLAQCTAYASFLSLDHQ